MIEIKKENQIEKLRAEIALRINGLKRTLSEEDIRAVDNFMEDRKSAAELKCLVNLLEKISVAVDIYEIIRKESLLSMIKRIEKEAEELEPEEMKEKKINLEVEEANESSLEFIEAAKKYIHEPTAANKNKADNSWRHFIVVTGGSRDLMERKVRFLEREAAREKRMPELIEQSVQAMREREEQGRLEMERMEREEQERLEAERVEAERRAEQERLEREVIETAERERIALVEEERRQREQEERERVEREQREREEKERRSRERKEKRRLRMEAQVREREEREEQLRLSREARLREGGLLPREGEKLPPETIFVRKAKNPFKEAFNDGGVNVPEIEAIQWNLVQQCNFEMEAYQERGLESWTRALTGLGNKLRNLSKEKKRIIKKAIKKGAIPIIMPGKRVMLETTLGDILDFNPKIKYKNKNVRMASWTYVKGDSLKEMIRNRNELLVSDIPDEPYIMLTRPTQRPELQQKTVDAQRAKIEAMNENRIGENKIYAMNLHEYAATQTIFTELVIQRSGYEDSELLKFEPLDSNGYVYTRFVSLPMIPVPIGYGKSGFYSAIPTGRFYEGGLRFDCSGIGANYSDGVRLLERVII